MSTRPPVSPPVLKKKPAAKKKSEGGALGGLLALAAGVAGVFLVKKLLGGNKDNNQDSSTSGKSKSGKPTRSPFTFDRAGSGANASTSSPSSSLPRNVASKNAKGKERAQAARARAEGEKLSDSNISSPAGSGKNACGSCGKVIKSSASTVSALEKVYHKECFRCQICDCDLSNKKKKFFEHGEKPACVECFAEHLAPTCAKCTKPVTEKNITAMGLCYHPECFTCSRCNGKLGTSFTVGTRGPLCGRCASTAGTGRR